MYRLFYDYETNGDILFLLIDPEAKVHHTKKVGNVVVLYDENERVVGANLFEVSNVAKIHSRGALFAPSEKLLAAINPWLVNAGIPALSVEKSSGFKVFQITKLEEHPLEEHSRIVTLSDGEKKYSTVSSFSALITVVPAESIVILPLPSIVATLGSDDFHTISNSSDPLLTTVAVSEGISSSNSTSFSGKPLIFNPSNLVFIVTLLLMLS